MSSTNDSETASSSTTDAKKEEGSTDLSAMKKALMDSKGIGKKSLWATTLDTFGMADGKNKKGDIKVDTLEQGLELLNDYINQTEAKGEHKLCWDLVPLDQFQATKEELLSSFLKWAEKDVDDDKNAKAINVSKALRRLEAYFGWMSDNRADLEEPLTVESIAEAAKLWNIQISYDSQGVFVWWIDLAALNDKGLKQIANKDHLRYVVWFAHLIMFDPQARQNGAMIVENLAHVSFLKLMGLLPPDLSAKLDRLTIGILPVKMKAIYVFGAATWMHVLMNLMKPFMSKKMRSRMILLPKKTDMQTFCDDLVTRANIPQGWCKLQGNYPQDAVVGKFASEKVTD